MLLNNLPKLLLNGACITYVYTLLLFHSFSGSMKDKQSTESSKENECFQKYIVITKYGYKWCVHKPNPRNHSLNLLSTVTNTERFIVIPLYLKVQ